MIDFEKILAFITQLTGSLSAWQTIIANIAAFVAVIFSHNVLNRWYATLNGMDNSIITAASWLFMISVYAIIYKAVSACFKAVSNFKANRMKEKEEAARKERTIKDIQALSKQEIAILKFVLAQQSHVAWLPDKDTSVILLETKSILRNVDFTRTKIVDFWHGSNRNLSCNLYQINNEALNTLTEMHSELSQTWRRIKPDRRLDECQ